MADLGGFKVNTKVLLLGVDGGGTNCRARLCAFSGQLLGEATTGPANLRLGLQQSFAEILDAAAQCLSQAGLQRSHLGKIVACLALAGASEPTYLAAAQSFSHPFRRTIVTTDAHAACLGAHGDNDGGVIVAGTGTVGWAVVRGQIHRVGGWGMPISDEGSGAWLGCEAVRRLLWALDGRIGWTGLLRHSATSSTTIPMPSSPGRMRLLRVISRRSLRTFLNTPRRTIRWRANWLVWPHVISISSLIGSSPSARRGLRWSEGVHPSSFRSLAERTKLHLVEPAGDALSGALHLAHSVALSLAEVA